MKLNYEFAKNVLVVLANFKDILILHNLKRWHEQSLWHVLRFINSAVPLQLVNFLTNIHKRHPLAHPLGWGMGCLCESSIWLAFCLSSCNYLHYILQYRTTLFNTLRPRQNGRRFADDTFKRIFLNENVWISITISLKFVPKGPINNIPALVQIMAWHQPGDKPLSEPMLVGSMTHRCVTRPQWDIIAINCICISDSLMQFICDWFDWYSQIPI